MPKSFHKLFLVIYCLILVSTTGCAVEALAGLEAADFAVVGGEATATDLVAAGIGEDLATGRIIVVNENAFYSELSRVKMEPPVSSGSYRLYVEEGGGRKVFGEVIDNKTIKIYNRAGTEFTVPENTSIYRVKSNGVRVHHNPSLSSYDVFKRLNTNDIVLVKRYNSVWSQVQFDKFTTGYVMTALLVPFAHHSSSQVTAAPVLTRKTCSRCNGQGKIEVSSPCNWCRGKGYNECGWCRGKGSSQCGWCRGTGNSSDMYGRPVKCINCDGAGKLICQNCKGQGSYSCSNCNGTGKFNTVESCPVCGGIGTVIARQ
jgi:hypothetical protein